MSFWVRKWWKLVCKFHFWMSPQMRGKGMKIFFWCLPSPMENQRLKFHQSCKCFLPNFLAPSGNQIYVIIPKIGHKGERRNWRCVQKETIFSFWGSHLINVNFYTLFEIFIFCPKIQLWFSEKNCRFFLGEKNRENVVVLDFLAVDNFDFTRKIVKKNWGEKLVKMLRICTF